MKPRTAADYVRTMTIEIFIAAVCLAGSGAAWGAEDAPAPTPAGVNLWDYNNWLELSLGGVFVRGDSAQFMQRRQVPANAPFGGIEDLHWEQNIGKRGLFTLDGRAIADNHDYLLKLGVQHPDKGYLRAGYREFRTWYDGSGGYFPPNRQWFNSPDDELAMDRGEAWFEAGLTLPDKPVITLRYSHQFRDGQKDSTSWGDTTLTGLPPPNNARKIVPSFLDIDERRDTVELDVRHTVSQTDFGLGFRYERLNQNNSRVEKRNPGEANDRSITQQEEVTSDLYNAHGFSQTRINKTVLFTLGGSFTRLETSLGGRRVLSPATSPPLVRNDEGFTGLAGGSQMNQYVANASVMITPRKYLTIVPSLRVEQQSQDGDTGYGEVAGIAAPVPISNHRRQSLLDVSESLAVRYTGVKNWVFFSEAQWLEGQGRSRETETELEDPIGLVLINRDTDSDRFTQKYKLGANWYPCQRANFSLQYYHKARANDYDHNVDSTPNSSASGNRYPAFLVEQNFETDDLNFRVTWRPFRSVTLVSRYDFQLSTVDTRADLLSKIQSGETTSHILSQSISWIPWYRLYLQGNATYAWDETTTPAVSLTGAAAHLVAASKNGYWNLSATAGFVLNDKTDLQMQYNYYRANDYLDNSKFSQPYGADDTAHGATVSLIRRINKNLRLTLKYGYSNYRDGASGGHRNYEAHLLASNLQFRF